MSIPEQISGISLGSAYIRPGTVGPITSVTYIAGGWITVDSKANLDAIDQSRTSTGQLAFVSESQQFYIATKVAADFITTFDDTVSWSEFTFSGSFSGSFSGDGSGLTGVGGVPGGTAGQLQYNSASAFGGAEVYYTSGGSIGIGITNPSARLVVAGDAVITGKITAEEFHTEFVSASIIYQSGSTKFGNSADDNHIFTGTVNITGSVIAPRFSGSFSGSFQGDGSQLTGIASTLALSGSTGNDVINLKTEALTLTGPANNIGVTVASNTATIAVSNNLTLTNVNLTGSFTGNFSGSIDAVITNAISASYATNAVSASVSDKVKVSTSGTNTSYYPTFVGGTGYQDVLIDSGNNITYNPSTNALTATTFIGALQGNASTATSATSASFATTASYATGYVKDGGGVADQIMVWKDGETASGSAALRYNTGGATLNITGNVLATSFTGSFSGSFAGLITNAVSASYAISASYAATASSADAFRVRNTLIASGLTYPTTDGLENQFLRTDGAGNLSFFDVPTIIEEVVSGEALTKGDPLYISGSQGAKPIVYRADAAVAAKMPVVYIALETTGSGADTRGIILGLIDGVDTTGYPVGTEIYVAAGGGWTSTRPTGTAIVQSLGYVSKEGSGGKGIVLNPGPFNLPNLTKDYVWKGNASGYPVAVASSSLIVNQALNATSASFATFANTAGTATSASFATNANTATSASFATNANTATSASHAIFANTAGTAATATSASHALYANAAGTATLATTATTALTASSADSFTIRNSATIVGDLVVGGKVTAEEFHTEFVSASIIFQSGSTIFGNSSDDTHLFTGSVSISHQLYAGLDNEVRPQVVGYNSATGELTYFNSSSILATAIPGGSDNQVQYNNNGVMAGATNFVWDGTNVGIGTASPVSPLTVRGGSSTVRIAGTTAAGYTNIVFDGTGRQFVAGVGNASETSIGLANKFFIYDGTASTTRITLNTDGNVGIGTTNPVAKLEVAYDMLSTYSPTALSSTQAVIANRNTSTSGSQVASLHLYATGYAGSTTGVVALNGIQDNGNASSGTFTIQTRNGGSYAERFRITYDGNVGIGVTNPSFKLDVAGSVKATSAVSVVHTSNSGFYSGPNAFQSFGSGVSTILLQGTTSNGRAGAVWFKGYQGDDVAALYVTDDTQDNYGTTLTAYSGSIRFATQTLASAKMTIAPGGALQLNTYGSGTNTGTPAKTLAVDSSGNVIELDVSSNGTGVANEVAVWKDTDTVSGSQALTWNGSVLSINGTLEANEKSFVIDHPTLPGKKLVYGVLEGPEHAVYCRGKISGNVIELPEEWTGLVDEESITVQLTSIGKHQNLYVADIKDNKVFIKNGDLLTSKINAYYYIQATRKDVKPLQTVRDK